MILYRNEWIAAMTFSLDLTHIGHDFRLGDRCDRDLGWLENLFPKLLFLIPLTWFPGFAWLIVAGFSFPRSIPKREGIQVSI
jgi:hypothetical protein